MKPFRRARSRIDEDEEGEELLGEEAVLPDDQPEQDYTEQEAETVFQGLQFADVAPVVPGHTTTYSQWQVYLEQMGINVDDMPMAFMHDGGYEFYSTLCRDIASVPGMHLERSVIAINEAFSRNHQACADPSSCWICVFCAQHDNSARNPFRDQ